MQISYHGQFFFLKKKQPDPAKKRLLSAGSYFRAKNRQNMLVDFRVLPPGIHEPKPA